MNAVRQWFSRKLYQQVPESHDSKGKVLGLSFLGRTDLRRVILWDRCTMKRALRVVVAIHCEGKKENKRKNSSATFLIHDRRNTRHCEHRGSRSRRSSR